jgi:hypothetical protein
MEIVGPILLTMEAYTLRLAKMEVFESGLALLHGVCKLLLVLMDLQKQLHYLWYLVLTTLILIEML